jgi:hypothetical protein
MVVTVPAEPCAAAGCGCCGDLQDFRHRYCGVGSVLGEIMEGMTAAFWEVSLLSDWLPRRALRPLGFSC